MECDFSILGKTYQIYTDKILGLSDRDTIIIIAAYIDSSLTRILRDRLILFQSKKQWFESSDFGLMNKTRLACSVGVITEKILDDVTFIIKIRNKFAHDPDNDFFHSEKTKNSFQNHMTEAKELLEALDQDVKEIVSDLELTEDQKSYLRSNTFLYRRLLCMTAAVIESATNIHRIEPPSI